MVVTPSVFAETLPAGTNSKVSVEVSSIDLQDENLVVNMNLNTSGVKLDSKIKTVYQPMLINGLDTVYFQDFAVTGKKRWAHDYADGNASAITFRAWPGKKWLGTPLTPMPQASDNYAISGSDCNYDITYSIPYNVWMGNAQFVVCATTYYCTICCCGDDYTKKECFLLYETNFPPEEFVAEIVYAEPTNEMVKVRNIVSNAYVDFKVNQTTILPKYMDNPRELALIKASIDSIAADGDINITNITLHGMASPEGPFANNERLAKGRTDALRDYIIKQHKLPKDMVTSVYQPVINWQGLADWLQSPACQANKGNVPNAADILAIVNSNMADFDRNQKIKTTYPDQYNWLLKNVYPDLRVTVYQVNFEVRSYESVAEIVDVMNNNPEKLSVYELYEAAISQGEDSQLFETAILTAVNTYPDDPSANLNAGLLAMKKGDYAAAQKYLDKAGDSDQANFARAQLAAMKGENKKALDMFKKLEKCKDASVAKAAAEAAKNLEKIVKFYGK